MSLVSLSAPILLAVLQVAIIASVGYVLLRRDILNAALLADLSMLVIRVTAPCLVFANAVSAAGGNSLSAAVLLILSGPAILGIGYIGGVGLARLFQVGQSNQRPVVAAATFQNLNYLPLSIVTVVLPPLATLFPHGSSPASGIGGAAIVDISLCSVLYMPLFWGLGLWWLQSEPGQGLPRLTWRQMLPPPVIGVLTGYSVALSPLQKLLAPSTAPLHVLLLATQSLGSLTVPLANLILGGTLALALGGQHLRARDALASVLGKLIWVPSVILLFLLGTRPYWVHDPALALAAFVLLLQGASPPATNLAVMSKSSGLAGSAGQIIPGLLLVAYPISLLSLPLWLTAFFHILSRS